MQPSKSKNRRPKYGLYAWPYFILMILLGALGIAITSVSIETDRHILLTGIVMAFVGFYLALGHNLMVKSHEKRENVFAKELLKFIEPSNNTVVLDVGSGTGRTAITIAKSSAFSEVIGIDIYSQRTIYGNSPRKAYANAELEGVAERVFFSYGSALDLPFKDKCFDAVTFGSILHLFADAKRKRAVEEVLRVLKDEGKLVLIEMPRTAKLTLLYWIPAFFIFQTRTYWIKLLQEKGLTNIKASAVGDIAIFCAQKQKMSNRK